MSSSKSQTHTDQISGSTSARMTGTESSTPFDLFMILMTCLALGAVTVGSVIDLPVHVQESLVLIDGGICIFFLSDFLLCLKRTPDKWRYLVTRGWLDLVSSLPSLGVLRWGRIVRAVLLVMKLRRTLRGSTVLEVLRRNLPDTMILTTISIGTVLLVGTSIAIVIIERGHDGNIKTGQDGLWWAIVTMTTVGYGDYYPQSPGGRLLGVLLMIFGIGVFGAFTSYIAAWLSRSRSRSIANEVRDLAARIDRLGDTIERLQERTQPSMGESTGRVDPLEGGRSPSTDA